MTAKRGPTGKESFENLNERLRHTLHQSKRTSEIPVKKKKSDKKALKSVLHTLKDGMILTKWQSEIPFEPDLGTVSFVYPRSGDTVTIETIGSAVNHLVKP